ncbi:hypothetical protein OTK49_02145 [Vibrio coralliirubri]|uniref:hypothetical protein n=1 Tax=Vibrio coralliirubri TaxID=1516159 RepID=UPI0022836C33|nr:hypothetical protein [Vibrio coralliirubri]MCY9861316.1 hypothetical protein [Vibrio coralliirubri]
MCNNLFLWLKLETGGLASAMEGDTKGSQCYPIFEAIAVVTDMELNEIESYRKAVYQDDADIMRSHSDAFQMHTQSGLLSEVADSGSYLSDIERELIELLQSCGAEPFSYQASAVAVLAGQNMSNHELQFVIDQMPSLRRFLHYSVFDLSTLMMGEAIWMPEAVHEREAYCDWSDDSPKAKVTRMIQNAKYFKNSLSK